jgi:hypothetical protein
LISQSRGLGDVYKRQDVESQNIPLGDIKSKVIASVQAAKQAIV